MPAYRGRDEVHNIATFMRRGGLTGLRSRANGKGEARGWVSLPGVERDTAAGRHGALVQARHVSGTTYETLSRRISCGQFRGGIRYRDALVGEVRTVARWAARMILQDVTIHFYDASCLLTETAKSVNCDFRPWRQRPTRSKTCCRNFEFPQREAAFFYGLFLRGHSADQLRRDISVPADGACEMG